ncbi:hypothetical protein A7X91_02440 [Stenotrophomonas maltophilia]|nr:hypothetical protein A9K70_00030 [Stenotrophomonas maltophilia]PZT14371.1 hypothetical protein A7X91_02440 [Stenotrophomonas maltophilia]
MKLVYVLGEVMELIGVINQVAHCRVIEMVWFVRHSIPIFHHFLKHFAFVVGVEPAKLFV